MNRGIGGGFWRIVGHDGRIADNLAALPHIFVRFLPTQEWSCGGRKCVGVFWRRCGYYTVRFLPTQEWSSGVRGNCGRILVLLSTGNGNVSANTVLLSPAAKLSPAACRLPHVCRRRRIVKIGESAELSPQKHCQNMPPPPKSAAKLTKKIFIRA